MQDNNQPRQPQFSNGGYPYPLEVYEDEIDLVELCKAIWGGKWIIAGVAALFAITSVSISLFLPNVYRSEVLLAPASSDEKGILSSMAGQLGSLASLAGIDLGGSTTDKTTLALEVLKSRAFITKFINKHELAVPLMASKGWDIDEGRWIIDGDIYDTQTNVWLREVKSPRKAKPSDQEMYKYFRSNVLGVSEDKKTGLVRVSVELMSPVAAQHWLSLLIKDLNDYMRASDVAEAKKSISYLQNQLTKTAIAEMQAIFYQLIEQQTKKMMLAEVSEEYVFKVVDPAIVPEMKFKPKRMLIVIIGITLGGFIGVCIVFVRHALNQRDSTREA